MTAGAKAFAPVLAALAARPLTQVFFRDDDAGWDTPRLGALLTAFHQHGLPLDLAVIPCAVDAPLQHLLDAHGKRGAARLGLHQHGYRHCSHERQGRSAEFGSARGFAEQLHDVAHGHALLQHKFGSALDPIFTPPWNRCTADTAHAMQQVGLRVLSRDGSAAPLPSAGVRELPIHIDWLKKRHGQRICGADFLNYVRRGFTLPLATRAAAVGIMLHHAVMSRQDIAALLALVAALRTQANVKFVNMREVAESD